MWKSGFRCKICQMWRSGPILSANPQITQRKAREKSSQFFTEHSIASNTLRVWEIQWYLADGGLFEAVMKAASSVSRATNRVYDDGEARWSWLAPRNRNAYKLQRLASGALMHWNTVLAQTDTWILSAVSATRRKCDQEGERQLHLCLMVLLITTLGLVIGWHSYFCRNR